MLSRMIRVIAAGAFCAAVGALSSDATLLPSRLRADEPRLKPGDRVVFLGDSITQAGAAPGGYVSRVKEALAKARPELHLEVFGAGVSGNKVPDLERRLDRDVLAKKPTLVVIYIGINDVWHSQSGRGTPKDQYEKGLRSLLERIRAAGAAAILCTPSVIGEKSDGTNPLDQMLDDYAAVSRAVAKDAHVPVIDLRKLFLAHLARHNPDNKSQGILTTDGVHLNAAGNAFVAARVLEALGVAEHGRKEGHALLRHVVLFKFKETSKSDDVQKIVAAFQALPGKIPQIRGFEWGTDVSVEGRTQGFTHCFVVTFKTAADRDAYLPHPAHKDFVSLAGPHIDKVLVVDYWAQN